MHQLVTWAQRWRLPQQAIDELCNIAAAADYLPQPPDDGSSEERNQADARLQAAQSGRMLWRNNVGALYDRQGRLIRYGLANDTKQQNDKMKSSDLIGIYPVRVTPQMFGQVLGVFWAVEVKEAGWQFSSSDREMAQLAYGNRVQSLGGKFQFFAGGQLC